MNLPDTLLLEAGSLTRSDLSPFAYGFFDTIRDGKHYATALIQDFDSDLAYGSWLMNVFDELDGDGDGIPNFSDEPMAPGAGGGWRQFNG